jgi:hypothetical protein
VVLGWYKIDVVTGSLIHKWRHKMSMMTRETTFRPLHKNDKFRVNIDKNEIISKC